MATIQVGSPARFTRLTARESVLDHLRRYPVASRGQIVNGKYATEAYAEALETLVREGRVLVLGDRCRMYMLAEAWPFVLAYYRHVNRIPCLVSVGAGMSAS